MKLKRTKKNDIDKYTKELQDKKLLQSNNASLRKNWMEVHGEK